VNGKPRIVYQKYLGRAEDIARAMAGKELDNPKYSTYQLNRNFGVNQVTQGKLAVVFGTLSP